MSGDTWIDTEAEASTATGPAAAAVLESVAKSLKEAPPEKRYDIEIDVTEKE